MNRTIATIATVAAMTIGGIAHAQTMGEGYDMLQTAIMNDFERMDIDVTAIDTLTLGQLAAIKGVLESEASEGDKKAQVEAIIANN